ncbi:MAG: hypothetical protein ACT4NL_02010 [Pseudomarimonas sp.]
MHSGLIRLLDDRSHVTGTLEFPAVQPVGKCGRPVWQRRRAVLPGLAREFVARDSARQNAGRNSFRAAEQAASNLPDCIATRVTPPDQPPDHGTDGGDDGQGQA